jgi:hypothetical protein
MTALGKILVFLTFALSLMMATWALGVYTNRIDFSDSKAKGGEGEYEKRRLAIDALNKELPPAETAWREARASLGREEKRVADDRVWYQDQLQHVREKATDANPVKRIVYAKADGEQPGVRKGQIRLDADGRPLLEPAKDRLGNALLSLARHNQDEQKVLHDLEEVQNQHAKQIDDAVALTERLIGKPGVKGLHQQLVEERKKRDDVVAEIGLVEPLLINTVVDAELVHKRHQALEGRLQELKKIGVAAGNR